MYIAFAALTSKIFAPGEDLTDGQFVLAMDHNELRTTKTGFPSKLHFTMWTSVLFTWVLQINWRLNLVT